MSEVDLTIPFSTFITTHDPLVSVVIPSYKKGPFLRDCVQSFLAQDYPNLEILIVNDGSPDNTKEVAEQLARENPSRIRFLDKPNGGVSDARNFGLREAKGRVVMTMDGDDMVRPNYLSTAIARLRQSEANLFISNQENFGREESEWIPHQYDQFLIRYDNCIPTPAVYDRLLWHQTGGFKTALGYAEDWEYWLNCSRYNLKVCRVPEKLTRYRMNDDGIASTFIDGKWQDCVSVVIMANEDLYPVEEVLEAHNHYPYSAPNSLNRSRVLNDIHPREWLLKLFLGLQSEVAGKFEEALQFYATALELSEQKNWQPIYRLGALLESLGKKREAIPFFHVVRTLRPDMSKFVKAKIEQFAVEGK